MTDMERLCKALNKAEWEIGARTIGGNMPKGERDVLIIRAVLRELREPTPDMIQAGYDSPGDMPISSETQRKRVVDVIYKGMIDTILQEAE